MPCEHDVITIIVHTAMSGPQAVYGLYWADCSQLVAPHLFIRKIKGDNDVFALALQPLPLPLRMQFN